MKVYELCSVLDGIAPLQRQEEWDNCGLIIGEFGRDVGRILTCLDVSMQIMEYARDNEYDFLISHHPLIFREIRKLVEGDPVQEMILYAIKNRIAVYAMHTNYDFADHAMNDHIAELLGLRDISGYIRSRNGEFMIGRQGAYPGGIRIRDLAALVMERLEIGNVTYSGEADDIVCRILVSTGSFDTELLGGELGDIDAVISGDIKYYTAKELKDKGILVVNAGHFGTEAVFSGLIKKQLSKALPDVTIDTVDFEKDIFNFISEQAR